jgi:hypothetical protein
MSLEEFPWNAIQEEEIPSVSNPTAILIVSRHNGSSHTILRIEPLECFEPCWGQAIVEVPESFELPQDATFHHASDQVCWLQKSDLFRLETVPTKSTKYAILLAPVTEHFDDFVLSISLLEDIMYLLSLRALVHEAGFHECYRSVGACGERWPDFLRKFEIAQSLVEFLNLKRNTGNDASGSVHDGGEFLEKINSLGLRPSCRLQLTFCCPTNS